MGERYRRIEGETIMTALTTAAWWIGEFIVWAFQIACISTFLAGIFVWSVGLVG